MARHSTALSVAKFAIEGSLGTQKSSPSWLWPWVTREDVNPVRELIQPRHLTGDRYLRTPVPGETSASGRVDYIVGPENFHKFLYGMFQTLSTATDSGSVVTHTFKAGNTIPTFEMMAYKGYVETWNRGGIIKSAEFAVDRNSILTCGIDWQFAHQQIVTAGTCGTSPTLSTLNPFTDMKGSMERDDGAVTDMDGFSLRLGFGSHDFKAMGNMWITDIVPGKLDLSWELACAFTSDTEFRRFLGDATDTADQQVTNVLDNVKLEWIFQTGENAGGYTAYPYQLKFTAYSGYYQAFPQGIESDDALLRSRPVALIRYDATGGCDLEVTLRNAISGANVVA